LTTFLAIVGALFLMYLTIRYFPSLMRLVVGFGVVIVVIFAIAGLMIVFLPVLAAIVLVLLIVRLLR